MAAYGNPISGGAPFGPSVQNGVQVGTYGPGGIPIAIGFLGQSNEKGQIVKTFTLQTSGTTSAGATSITVSGNTLGLAPGMPVSGTNIPTGTVVTTVTYGGTSFGISQATSGTINNNTTLTFSNISYAPNLFQSQRNPGVFTPIGPAVSANIGNWLPPIYDTLYDYGYNVHFVNGSLGSISFVRHVAGWNEVWNANETSPISNPIMRNARAASGHGFQDAGDNGTVVTYAITSGANSGKTAVFQCTAGGANVWSMYQSSTPIPGSIGASSGSVYNLDYIYTPAAGGTTGASNPFTSYAGAVGGTVTDNALTWTCVTMWTTASGPTDAAFSGYGSAVSFSDGKYGFDPLGILNRLHQEMQRLPPKWEKWIYLGNAQSDEFTSTTAWYTNALEQIIQYFLNRGYKVMVGLSCYDNSGNNVTAYNNLTTQLNNALTYFSGNPNVVAGANLYTLMGSTAGSNGLTYQSDNVHLDAAGSLVAANYISSAFQSVLPYNG